MNLRGVDAQLRGLQIALAFSRPELCDRNAHRHVAIVIEQLLLLDVRGVAEAFLVGAVVQVLCLRLRDRGADRAGPRVAALVP